MSNKLQRLDKVLGNLGYGSRKEIKALVKQGRVSVDGIEAKDSGMQLNPETSIVEVDGLKINYRRYIYMMMNKPQGVISATFDKRHKTVVDLLPEDYAKFDLFPAGRLDIDTEGLILLTNDGQLAHEILSPRKHVPKTYFARISGLVNDEDKNSFKEGIALDDGYKCLPADLEIINASAISEIRLTIFEGKFHQVKRMFEAVGKEVVYLKRLSMGGLSLDPKLEPGQVRELSADEVGFLSIFSNMKSPE